jgi:aspartyl-tRNA(Asn)/glutamyl-tRNA(Gln) amidotransferase subunit C
MSLTQEQIKKIAEKLSKIHLDETKTEELKWDLNNILKYFDLLNEVDTENVKPTYSVIEKENSLREDIEQKIKDPSVKELLECSNQDVIANQIAINNIMK